MTQPQPAQATIDPSRHLVWAGVFLLLSLLIVILYLRNAFEQLDQLAFAFAETIHTPWLTALITTVTHLGGGAVLVPLGVLLVIAFWIKGYRIEALVIVITLLVGDLLNEWLKNLFARPRPMGWGLIEPPDSYSFPSGHAMVAAAFYGVLAHFLRSRLARSSLAPYIKPATILLITLIAASRVYLGVHYLSDVLGGLCMAAVWYFAVRYLYDFAVSRWRSQSSRAVTP